MSLEVLQRLKVRLDHEWELHSKTGFSLETKTDFVLAHLLKEGRWSYLLGDADNLEDEVCRRMVDRGVYPDLEWNLAMVRSLAERKGGDTNFLFAFLRIMIEVYFGE